VSAGSGAGCGPKALVGIGPFFMLVGAALGIYAVVTGGSSVVENVSDFFQFRDDLVAEVVPPGSDEVELAEGDHTIFAIGDALVVTGIDDTSEAVSFTEPELTLTGPDGEVVDLDRDSFSSSYVVDVPDGRAVGMATLTIDEPGTYLFDVGEGDARIETVGLAEGTFASDAKDALFDLGPAAIWGALGAASFGFGVLLLLVGAIWWVVAANRAGGRRGGSGGFGGLGGLGTGFTGGSRGGFGIQGRPWQGG
jgi:hypothetical protein